MKRFVATFVVGMIGIAVWGLLLVNADDRLRGAAPDIQTDEISPDDVPADPTATPETGDADGTVPAGDAAGETATSVTRTPLIESKPVRPVEPEMFEYPVVENGTPLERIDDRTASSAEKPREDGGLKPILVPRPVTVQAGVLTSEKRILTLAGIVPTEPERQCTDVADGKDWPCGTMARTALRLFIRNRAINCDLPAKDWTGAMSTVCRLGDRDLGGWLVENGWVTAEKGSDYETLGGAAEAGRRGLFGADPRKAGPDPAVVEPEAESDLGIDP